MHHKRERRADFTKTLQRLHNGIVMQVYNVHWRYHTIVGVPDERMAMTVETILRAARQNIKPVLVLDPPEPEVYVIDGKQLSLW